MKEVREIKNLQSQHKKLLLEAEFLKIQLQNIQDEYIFKKKQADEIRIEMLKAAKTETIKVSEHAILRYLERVKGLNIEEIEKEIVSEEIIKFVEQLGGSGQYPNKGFNVLMKNFTVTTITV